MSIKAQLEAIIYAAEDPITLDQMAALLKDDLLALKTALPAVEPDSGAEAHSGRSKQKTIWARLKNRRQSHPRRRLKRNLRRLSFEDFYVPISTN